MELACKLMNQEVNRKRRGMEVELVWGFPGGGGGGGLKLTFSPPLNSPLPSTFTQN